MRIRSIKPEFWRSDDITALTIEDRLLFIGLWSYVDDNGVGLDKLSAITADLFAGDLERDPSETFARVSRGLQNLSDHGRIVRYEAEGKDFLAVANWSKHQRIDKPNKPRFPQPDAENATPRESVATPSRDIRETPAPGTEEQGNRGTEEQAPAPRKRGSRIPDDFTPSLDAVAWAIEECPDISIDQETAEFIDYWRAVPGQKGVKLDWDATWRNAMRRKQKWADERKPAKPAAPVHSPWDTAARPPRRTA